jgi:hypothetical protein
VIRPHLIRVVDHSFAEQKAQCQLRIVARSSYGDGDGPALPRIAFAKGKLDFQRFFGRNHVFNRTRAHVFEPLHREARAFTLWNCREHLSYRLPQDSPLQPGRAPQPTEE